MSLASTSLNKSYTGSLVPIKPLPSPHVEEILNKALFLFSKNQSQLAQKAFSKLSLKTRQKLIAEIWIPSTPCKAIFSFLFEAKKREYAALTQRWETYHASQYLDVSKACRSEPLKSLGRSNSYDANLVKLKEASVNAHLVLGRRYILTEHPREQGFAYFWQMIDEYDVPVICMLNQNNERNCSPYYPKQGSETYGPYTVALTDLSTVKTYDEELQRDVAVISIKTFQYSKEKGKEKKTTLLHFRYWQDTKTPFPDELRFYLGLKRQYAGTSKAPVVIHCKKGQGRTGLFCAIDYLLPKAENGQPFSVLSTVEQLRHPATGRHPLMVGNEEQYLYCHSFLWNTHKV